MMRQEAQCETSQVSRDNKVQRETTNVTRGEITRSYEDNIGHCCSYCGLSVTVAHT